MTKKHKSRLQYKVGYTEIDNESTRLDCKYNEVMCGRLRQPVKLKTNKQKIEGICSLDWRPCRYKYPIKECPTGREDVIMAQYKR